jgi:two-component system, response regulator RegA
MENTPQSTILLVDSDNEFRRALGLVAQAHGYAVVEASTLAEGRHALTRLRGALLITDMMLPDGSGIDLLEDVQRQRSMDHVPVTRSVVLTACGSLANAVSAAKLGASDYLAKPSDFRTIEAALLGRSEAQSQRVFARPEVVQFRYMLAMFEHNNRNLSVTGRQIGMHRRTLQRILRRWGIDPSLPSTDPANIALPRQDRLACLYSELLSREHAPGNMEIRARSMSAETQA